MKKIITLLVLALGTITYAQTNLQIQYDFGRNNLVTATLEGSYADNWGSTFFFADFDIGKDIQGTYGELSRSLNFWQNTKLVDLSAQVEFNAGVYKSFVINPALLLGVNYTLHNDSYSNLIQFQILYKTFFNKENQKVPLQFTAVWNCLNIFGVTGLQFTGFADFWWQEQLCYTGKNSIIFLSEPQLWYNVGQHFNCHGFSVGGEVEFAANFNTEAERNFTVYPCLGIRWTFQ